MKIKKLNKEEINDISRKIEALRNDDYYKFYFNDEVEENFPLCAYLLDDSYYVDFTVYENDVFMGVINLNKEIRSENILYDVIKIFNTKLKEYKVIWQWCFLENKTSLKFHNYLKKKYKNVYYKGDKYSIIGVFYDKKYKRKIRRKNML